LIAYQLWIADNGTQLITTYDLEGNPLPPAITVVPGASGIPPSPTGIVNNKSSGYIVSGSPALVLVSTEQGTINAYNSITNLDAPFVVDNSTTGANYKGIAITPTYLYAANFTNGLTTGTIDVFTNTFGPTLPGTFIDPTIPSTFSPFNVVYIKPFVYVCYAKKNPADPHDDLAGPGNGYINIFTTNGVFVRRFISNGKLNSPWALIRAPEFTQLPSDSFLVGNFGDGRINVYNARGKHIGIFRYCDNIPITINNLWGLTRGPKCMQNIYFASGPNDENNGLVGRLTKC